MREKPLARPAGSLGEAAQREEFAASVRYYLSLQPRQLPSRYFYDALGSALFEAICRLPWYHVTRAEMGLLERHGREILRPLEPLTTVVELGSGSGEKLDILLTSRRRSATPLTVHLIDVSPTALASAADMLSGLDEATIVTHAVRYEEGLARVAALPHGSSRELVLFLGSNIGNFDRPGAAAFLRTIRSSVADGDAVLLGTDLVKSERELLLAYDDPLGVTAAFNRNLLVRINRELDGNFDLDSFDHRAVWNAEESRVEMHLVCRSLQHIVVRGADLEFTMQAGESIWTESSYKYRPDGVAAMLEQARFSVVDQWVDGGFALTLALRSA